MSRVIYSGSRVYLETDEGQRFLYDENSEPLGAGAMGVVYRGYNYDTHEIVAIKRVKDRYANVASIRLRAKQEASLKFLHHNLVEMIGYCEESPDSGPIFIVSNYVQGETMDSFVKSHLSHLPDACKRICDMCYPVFEALAYIHQKGIVHADIKPSNIMVENGCNVRLMDLGISQIHDTNGTMGTMGTPRYAAPEQFGDSKSQTKLTSKADIYELGVTIYELIANKNPFDSTTIEEIKDKHLKVVLPYLDNVPNAVVDVLRKATAVDPQCRYATAYEFRDALKESFIIKSPSIWPWVVLILIIAVSILAIVLLSVY